MKTVKTSTEDRPRPSGPPLPRSVRRLRVLLFTMASLWFAMAVGTFAMPGAYAPG